jgi:hypothetical protein
LNISQKRKDGIVLQVVRQETVLILWRNFNSCKELKVPGEILERRRGNVEEFDGRTIYWTLPPKRHLFKLGLTDNTTCERCLEEDDSATHILHDCEAIAHLIFRHLGQFFMEPSDYYDAPINEVLHFVRNVGLIKALITRGSTIDH